MTHHIFPPEGRVVIAELSIAWVSNRLGHWRWPFPYRARGHQIHDARSRNALDECEQLIWEELKTGRIVAFAHLEGVPVFYRITQDYWEEESSVMSLQGRLYDIAPGQHFSESLERAVVLVNEEDAIDWLNQQGITRADPYFPLCLRIEPPAAAPLRKSQYDRDAFIDEAVRRLHELGGLRGKRSQGRFEEEMRAWYEDNIGTPPKMRTIRNYVTKARERFARENQLGLGN